jgi:hypothetical protein
MGFCQTLLGAMEKHKEGVLEIVGCWHQKKIN